MLINLTHQDEHTMNKEIFIITDIFYRYYEIREIYWKFIYFEYV